MADLQRELQQLSPAALRELLSASGHGQLLREGGDQPATVAEVEQLVAKAKDEGNEFFRQNKLQDAVAAYSRSIEMDPSHALCFSNRAAAYLKLNELELAAADCSKAIELAPTIKSFMRRAVAYIGLRQYQDAVADLTAALEFEPRNKECHRKLNTIVDTATECGASVELRRAAIRAAVILSVREGWTKYAVRGNPGPSAVNGHTLFVGAIGRIYLFGGRAVREQKPQVFALDENDNSSWDAVPIQDTDAPSSRAWHTTSAISNEDSECYCVYGGVSSRGEDSSVHLLVPTLPRGFRWVLPRCLQDPKEIPAPRSGHAAVSAVESGDQVVYIFGGRTKQGVSDQLLVLRCSSDATSDSVCGTIIWDEVNAREQESGLSSWPAARDGHSMCLLNGTRPRLVVFGGNGQLNDVRMNDVWVFDLQQKTWTLLECSGDIPPPRSYHTAHVVNEFLFIFCGRIADSEDASVYMLDTSTSQWFKVPIPKDRVLTPRAWHSSVLTEAGKVFVLGGGTYHGPLKDAAALDLSFFRTKVSSLNHAAGG